MNLTIKSYYKTTPIDEETLRKAIASAKDQENKIFQLFKQFGTMTTFDVYDTYNVIVGPIIMSSVGRAIDTLKKQNVIISLGTIPGEFGRPVNLYKIVDNPPIEVEKRLNNQIPKSFKINVIFDSNGNLEVDSMVSELADKIELLAETFNLKTI